MQIAKYFGIKKQQVVRKIARFIKKFSASRGKVSMFLRAQLTSQVATVVDNGLAFALKKLLDINRIKSISIFSHGFEAYVFATMVGQLFGGLTACIINYRWTFKSLNIKFQYVLIRFVLVWLVSLFLNTFFTFLLTEWLKETPFVASIFGEYNSDDIFIFVKLFVALIVGFVWNYLMYKYFVFRDVNYKKFFQKILKGDKIR